MAEAEVTVAEVKAFKTQSGNTRFVLRDGEGREYTTFREQIARDAVAAEGRRARITFHEQQRGNFTNVYLDSVEPLGAAGEEASRPKQSRRSRGRRPSTQRRGCSAASRRRPCRRRSCSSACSPSRSASPTTFAASPAKNRTSRQS